MHLRGGLFIAILLFAEGASPETAVADKFAARIGEVATLGHESARTRCRELLDRASSDTELSLEHRAATLEGLRDACLDALPWKDEANLAIGRRVVDLRRELEAATPDKLVEGLRLLGICQHYATHTALALESYLEAEAVARRWLGRGTDGESLGYALEMVSSAYLDLGDLDAAADAAEESEQVRRGLVPPRPESVVRSLNALARVEEQRRPERARDILLEAYKITTSLGEAHLSARAWMASNLGWIHESLGDLSTAQTYLHEAEELRASLPGEQRLLASTRHILARVLFQLGQIPESIETYERAARGLHDWLGDDPYRYADAVDDLAVALEDAGRWRDALRHHLEALGIREAAVRSLESDPGTSPDLALKRNLARSLTKAAALAARLGEGWSTEALERALAIYEEDQPSGPNLNRADTLFELSRVYASNGRRDRALHLLAQSQRELRAVGDKGPRSVAAARLSAELASDIETARRVLEEAAHLAKSIYGPESPRMVPLLLDRARLERRSGRTAEALSLALEGHHRGLEYSKTVAAAFPRDHALAFTRERRQGLDLAVEYLVGEQKPTREVVSAVWQAAIDSRNLVFDIEVERQNLLRAGRDPALTKIASEVLAKRRRMAYFLVRSQVDASFGDRFRAASEELQEAETRLAQLTREEVGLATPRPAKLLALLERLPTGAALAAFYRYRSIEQGTSSYLAFVSTASRLHAVDLGSASRIDSLVAQWRWVQADQDRSRISNLERRWRGLALRKALWDPIAEKLGDPGPVFLVPDGEAHVVPLGALPAGEDRYLIEDGWMFGVLDSERDLEARSRPAGRAKKILLVGGVDYDRAPGALETALGSESPAGLGKLASSSEAPGRSRGLGREHPLARRLEPSRSPCAPKMPSRFEALPGTTREIEDLASLWMGLPPSSGRELSLLRGAEATEDALRARIGDYNIVHLATHGLASTGRCSGRPRRVRGIASTLDSAGMPHPVGGLVMAGANRRDRATESAGDGILTESEVLSLDLRGVEWLVLSACDSGLGDLHPGEGILGLRRAFRIAGAETLVLSLWPVGDGETRHFMVDLYRARFEDGLPGLEAWHRATLEALDRSRARADGQPYSWAGFILTGNWN